MPDPKAGAVPFPPGYEACGCCDGVMAATPQPGYNRIGLSSVSYRIGDHAQFKASLIAGLSSASWPALAGLRTRDPSDFTVGLIDAFACAADVLTFYQERIANESYLRTASERVSMQELGRLIGYRLKPGVAAETLLAFALETPPVPPAALPPEPGNFVTGVPSVVTLNAALKVQSVPGPEEKPQTFETVETIEARPQWNAVRPWLTEVRRPGRGSNETFLAGVRTGLKAGDPLLLLDDEFRRNRASNRWDFRLLDSVQVDVANDRTRVTWKRGLGSISPWMDPAQVPEAFALRKRTAAYGHNAPMWRAMVYQYRLDYGGSIGTAILPEWPEFTLSPSGATADGGHVDLDSAVAEISAGSFVVLAKGEFNQATETNSRATYVELFDVLSTNEVSRDQFALSGKVSRLRLRGDNYERFQSSVRETAVFVQSEPLAFAPYPVLAAVSGDQVPAAVGADGLQPGRRLIVRGLQTRDGVPLVHACTLVAATPAGASRCTLEIEPPLPQALRRDSVVVHANVALATHGESVSQVLGSGDASLSFQSFELKQLPLTHRAAPTESGAQSELVLRVGNIEWREVSSLYARASDERAFRLDLDEQGRSLVRFGDGVNGARLPSGVNNIRRHARWASRV
jgi:hypothetical protein